MDNFLFDLSLFLFLINFTLTLYFFNKLGKQFKILGNYSVFVFFILLILKITIYYGIRCFFISNIFLIGQFFFLSYFYYSILKNKLQRKVIQIAAYIIPLLLAIQYAFDYKIFLKFNLFEIYTISFFIIMYVIFHFYEMLSSDKYYFYYNSIATLIYQLGCVILFSTGNLFLAHNLKLSLFTFDLHSILSIFTHIFSFLAWNQFYNSKNKILDV
jgi:hypothetical protein